jgi:hypothetical protein
MQRKICRVVTTLKINKKKKKIKKKIDNYAFG